jgi:phage-related minor tail protein
LPVPFAQGGVISSPIAFPLAGNRLGVAGERGAEAILPLARGPDGRLGVQTNGGGAVQITFNIATPDAESFQRSQTQIAALLARAVGHGQRNL